jgi:hypothetical protein
MWSLSTPKGDFSRLNQALFKEGMAFKSLYYRIISIKFEIDSNWFVVLEKIKKKIPCIFFLFYYYIVSPLGKPCLSFEQTWNSLPPWSLVKTVLNPVAQILVNFNWGVNLLLTHTFI